MLSCVLRDQKTLGDMDDVRRHPRCRYQTHRKTSRSVLLTLARGRSAASQSVQLVSTGCVLNSGLRLGLTLLGPLPVDCICESWRNGRMHHFCLYRLCHTSYRRGAWGGKILGVHLPRIYSSQSLNTILVRSRAKDTHTQTIMDS